MIKITESQLERLVLILKEQTNNNLKSQYYFDFNRKQIFLKLNDVGGYDVFSPSSSGSDVIDYSETLPSKKELGVIIDTKNFDNITKKGTINDKSKIGNELAQKLLNPEKSNSYMRHVMFVNDDNIPYIAILNVKPINKVLLGKYSEVKPNDKGFVELKGNQYVNINNIPYVISLEEVLKSKKV